MTADPDRVVAGRVAASDTQRIRPELTKVSAELDCVVDAITKVGISTARETRLKALERRQRELDGQIRAAERRSSCPTGTRSVRSGESS